MTSLSDRLQVARPQWEAQLDAFHTLGTRALDNAEQLLALNLRTSRASLDQATGALQQMLHATDARDLFAIGTQAQDQWQQVFSYSRELLGIAMGARQRGWSSIPQQQPPQLPQLLELVPAPGIQLAEQASIALAEATTVTGEIATDAVDTTAALAEDTLGVGDQSTAAIPDSGLQPAGQIEPVEVPAGAPTELDAETAGEAPSGVAATAPSLDEETSANVDALVDIVIADEVPPAKAKPLVAALNEVAPRPVSAEHPLSSTVPLQADGHVDLPLVTPAEATPPVRLSTGPATAERRRSSRKKS